MVRKVFQGSFKGHSRHLLTIVSSALHGHTLDRVPILTPSPSTITHYSYLSPSPPVYWLLEGDPFSSPSF